MEYKNDILLQECEIYCKNKFYIVKPLSFYYIRKKEFDRDNIFTFGDNLNKLLFSNLISETGRTKINKWLERLVTTSNGEKFNLQIMGNDEWEKEDLIKLFEIIFEISGLKENTEDKEDPNNKDDGYMSLYSNLLMNRTMTKQEILDSSLPYLIEVSKEINEIRVATSGLGGFSGIGGTSGKSQQVEKCTTPQDFYS